ncbi:MAG: AbgT family transporter, partial [Bacteroidota bacterium]
MAGRFSFSAVFSKSLDFVERVGNALPHPASLFAILAASVALVSWVGTLLDLTAVHPANQSVIVTKSLLSHEGIAWIYSNITENFVRFPPLGYVLVAMIGIGVAEGSGLFSTLIRALVLNAPKHLITASVVFAGVISHLASEAGYVILIPLGAMIFHALGRHPMAGLAAAFCGVSGGFGANFLIGSVDPILAGLTQSAAQIIDPAMTVNAAVNLYFMFASAIMIVILGTLITERIVEPRLGKYTGSVDQLPVEQVTPLERKGLRGAGIAVLALIVALALTIIPENGLLRNPETGEVLHSPFFDGLITGILLFFVIPGLVYGFVTRSVRSDKDVVKYMTKSLSGLAGYIVLVF